MIYGYIRPPVEDNKAALEGQSVDKLYMEDHPHAKKREQLEALLMVLEPGDEVYVQSLMALADSMTQFHELLQVFKRDSVTVHFVEEGINSRDVLEWNLAEAVAFMTQLQTNLKRRQAAFSIEDARQQGKPIGRPKKSDENLQRAFAMYESKAYTLQQIKEKTGISKSTLYRYLDQ